MTDSRQIERYAVPYAGVIILAGFVVGGGTGRGLWTDHLLELLMVPALFVGIAGFTTNRLDRSGRVLVIATLLLLGLQFVPVLRELDLPDPVRGWGFWSPAPQQALEAVLISISALGFFLYVVRMSDKQRERCLPFFYVGFLFQLMIGVIQLAGAGSFGKLGFLPFEVQNGLFANQNHYASLVFAMIPFIAYGLIIRARQVIAYIAVVLLIVVLLFALGSRAGMAVSALLALGALVWFWPAADRRWTKGATVLAAVVSMLAAIWVFASNPTMYGDNLRLTFFSVTWRALQDYWLTGSGLGSFTLIYPAYETPERIFYEYANHAHNDFLELFLEMGLAGGIVIAAFFWLILRNHARSPLAEAAFLLIVALSLHSLVDYPLRTLSLLIPFAFSAAVVLSARASGREPLMDKKKIRRRKTA